MTKVSSANVHKNFQKGQSIIEVLASITIVIVVIIALVIATTFSLKSSTFSKNQSLATKYAQEGIEKIRQERDNNPDGFWARTITHPPELNIDTEGNFDRTTTLDYIDDDQVKVTVTVSWQDNSGNHESNQSTIFTRWGAPTPAS